MKTLSFWLKENASQTVRFYFLLFSAIGLASCNDNVPQREDVPELITQVTLSFTPQDGGQSIVVTALDPDGEGVQDIQVDKAIVLDAMTTYTMEIGLINELALEGSPGFDITIEVAEEADEHVFFFAWDNNIFSDPSGVGNVDDRSAPVNYIDFDDAGLPLGLSTLWTTGSATSGNFRIVLKHQPELKSETSDSTIGETDLDVTFTLNVNG